MLVFPSLGTKAEVSLRTDQDSECPLNLIMYPETKKRSIHFYRLYVSLPSTPEASGQYSGSQCPIKTKPRFANPDFHSPLTTDHSPLTTGHCSPATPNSPDTPPTVLAGSSTPDKSPDKISNSSPRQTPRSAANTKPLSPASSPTAHQRQRAPPAHQYPQPYKFSSPPRAWSKPAAHHIPRSSTAPLP
jgi:hypothetical protein